MVPARFNGPLASGNGGYSAAAFSRLVAGPAAVSLRSPVPLDTELAVERDGDGAAVRDGEALVATVEPADELPLETPAPVTVEEARRAAQGYRGLADGEFCRCFVCGRAREDALGVFAGEVEGREAVASPWTPPPWSAGPDGGVRAEIAGAVLDCPTYFAAYAGSPLRTSFLARFQLRIERPIAVGEEHVVLAWPLATEGRKRQAGSAILAADGRPLAVARALLIEPRDQ